jgi:hypothetical protein
MSDMFFTIIIKTTLPLYTFHRICDEFVEQNNRSQSLRRENRFTPLSAASLANDISFELELSISDDSVGDGFDDGFDGPFIDTCLENRGKPPIAVTPIKWTLILINFNFNLKSFFNQIIFSKYLVQK